MPNWLFKRVRFAARHQSGIGDAQPGETRLVNGIVLLFSICSSAMY